MKSATDHQPTTRFSQNVDFYARYRPRYPDQLVNFLKEEADLSETSRVADIGAGTGIFSELLLEKAKCEVIAVEPNAEMRAVAEQAFAGNSQFQAIDAPAEATTLADHSIDLITCAQAFHWFDHTKVREEFQRILKPQGHVALIWNFRASDANTFMRAYEELLETFGINYHDVCAERAGDANSEAFIREFFSPGETLITSLPNQQVLDWEGFRGRLLSTSYVPKQGENNHAAMLEVAREIFDTYCDERDQITFLYDTKVYLGSFSK